jgi:putative transposase
MSLRFSTIARPAHTTPVSSLPLKSVRLEAASKLLTLEYPLSGGPWKCLYNCVTGDTETIQKLRRREEKVEAPVIETPNRRRNTRRQGASMDKHLNDSPLTQENIHTDLRSVFRTAIHQTLTLMLEAEIQQLVGASSGSRTGGRRDFRNGSYPRQVMTTEGVIDLEVPRSREHGAAVETLGRYKRRVDNIDDAIVAAYVSGVSTRKMANVTQALLGTTVDKSTVSRITKQLEIDIEALRKAPIGDDIVYLYLDATFLKTRWAREVEQTAALVAYGVDRGGYRRLLGISVDLAESESSWSELLSHLIDRGLRGVELVISDEHAGLCNAVRKLFPDAKRQRCSFHFMRNISAKCPTRLHARLGRELSRIFDAPSLLDAKRRAAALKAGLGKQLPEAMEVLDKGWAAATQFYSFPKVHWKKIRTTNGVERLNVEIKRRTRSVGSFPDRDSCLRLVTAVVVQQSKQWSYRPYLSTSGFRTEIEKEDAAKLAA